MEIGNMLEKFKEVKKVKKAKQIKKMEEINHAISLEISEGVKLNDEMEVVVIKIKATDAFLALFKSLMEEEAMTGTTAKITLILTGMKDDLMDQGYTAEDWFIFAKNILLPTIKKINNND